ncbi:MAG: YafY family protein [Thermomicrobiales bacterium]
MRADRLVATLLLLQSRGRVTAAEVAAELEVSVKTARRDLEALAMAGVPVYAQPGRGGGWQVIGGARTDLTGLTSEEARALFLVAGPAAVDPAARSALRKLVLALPAPFRGPAEAAAAATLHDPVGWGGAVSPHARTMETLHRAVIDREQMELTYRAADGKTSVRLIDPYGLVAKAGLWYLVAGTAAGQRTFRVDRIQTATLTGQPATVPEDFNLTTAWREIANAVDAQRTRVCATVRATPIMVVGLRAQFGADVGAETPADTALSEVEICAASSDELAERLAGWGRAVTVRSPDAVRVRLAAIGAELLETYGATPT